MTTAIFFKVVAEMLFLRTISARTVREFQKRQVVAEMPNRGFRSATPARLAFQHSKHSKAGKASATRKQARRRKRREEETTSRRLHVVESLSSSRRVRQQDSKRRKSVACVRRFSSQHSRLEKRRQQQTALKGQQRFQTGGKAGMAIWECPKSL